MGVGIVVTMQEFIDAHNITMLSDQIDQRPEGNEGWDGGATHWRCTLIRNSSGENGSAMQVIYSQGSGHADSPTTKDVLNCIVSSADVTRYTTFEDWAEDMGFSSDSRKAEWVWQACRSEAISLRGVLGDDLFHELLHEVERD